MNRLPWLPIFALLFFLLLHSWFGPDVWYHLTWGRNILATFDFAPPVHHLLQQPIFANNYWLFQVLLQVLFQLSDIWGISFLFAGVWLVIVWQWLRLSQAALPLAMIFVLLVQLRFEHRPEVFSYLFLVLLLNRLMKLDQGERDLNKADLVWGFILQVVWTNMHGYFVFGVLSAAAFAVTHIRRSSVYLLASMILATLCTPFFLSSWEAVYAYKGVSRALREINHELFAPSLTWSYPMPLFWLLWVSMVTLVILNLWRRRNIFACILALAALALGLQAIRNIPLFLIFSGPLLASTANWNFWKKSWLTWSTAAAASACALLVLTGQYHRYTQSLASFGIKLEPASYPIAATTWLNNFKFKGRLFNDSYDGGYLSYFAPQVTLTGDSYFADPDTTLKYFAAIKNPDALIELDRRYTFDALLINIENLNNLAYAFDSGEWNLVHSDLHSALFLRKSLGVPSIRLSDSQYYQGEDLRHWVYAFGTTTWMSVARRYRDRSLVVSLLTQLQKAKHVPKATVDKARDFASQTKDAEIFDRIHDLEGKTYTDGVLW
jgi:hypothetical protein